MQLDRSMDMKNFESVIGSGVSLVDFNALWCAPCRAQQPIVKELSEDFKGHASILEIDVDENQHLAKQLRIVSIPTLILFKNGRELDRFVGLHSKAFLAEAIHKALA